METIDQFGRKVTLPDVPLRIISLVPSQTELLADLNLDDRVVGITRFCERPKDWFYKKARVGGTKDVDIERISALKPDLILGNAEENTKKIISQLEAQYPVWLSDVKDLQSACDMILSIGEITKRRDTSTYLVERIRENFAQLQPLAKPLKVLYLIWKDPYMAAGRDTFIHSMLELAGFENVLTDPESRYPKLEIEEISQLNPDLVLLSSEPYPFRENHIEEIKEELNLTAITVDGAMLSWYGSRLLHTPEYLQSVQDQLQ